MKIPATMRFHRVEVPPRCRKPREVPYSEQVEREIPEVSTTDAPIAFILRRNSMSGTRRIRWWDQRTWEECRPSRSPQNEAPIRKSQTDRILLRFGTVGSSYRSEEEARAGIPVDAVFIGPTLWIPIGEPRYVIQTFGLGANHGGTWFFDETGYNSNIHRSRYYRADQWDEMLAAAIRTAEGRGDTNDAKRLRRLRSPTIKVLVPEAVRLDPANEHGEGDPFLNQLDRISSAAKDSTVAGFAALALLAKEMSS